MVLQSTDLMIGDWVFVSEAEPNVKVAALQDDGDVCWQRSDGSYQIITANCINPIPLTSEILEKNGWKLCHNEGFLFCLDEERELYIDVLDGEIANYFRNISGDYEWHLITYCKYVHQFQHALKLCGIEKEIIL